MNNDKKLSFQKRKIEELEKQNCALKAENKAITKENESYKRLLSLKDKELSDLQKLVYQMRDDYSSWLKEIRLLHGELKNAIYEANNAKMQFSKRSQDLLNRIKRYK